MSNIYVQYSHWAVYVLVSSDVVVFTVPTAPTYIPERCKLIWTKHILGYVLIPSFKYQPTLRPLHNYVYTKKTSWANLEPILVMDGFRIRYNASVWIVFYVWILSITWVRSLKDALSFPLAEERLKHSFVGMCPSWLVSASRLVSWCVAVVWRMNCL